MFEKIPTFYQKKIERIEYFVKINNMNIEK